MIRFAANRKVEEEGAGEEDESTGEEAIAQVKPCQVGSFPSLQLPLRVMTDGEVDDDLSPPLL